VLRPQFVEKREVVRALRVGEPSADRFAGAVDSLHRAGQEHRLVQELERRLGHLDLTVRPPDEAAPHLKGMQRAHEHRNPPERQTGIDKTETKLLQHVLRPYRRTRAVSEPADRGRQRGRLCGWR